MKRGGEQLQLLALAQPIIGQGSMDAANEESIAVRRTKYRQESLKHESSKTGLLPTQRGLPREENQML